ncbi:DUF3558 domain-containing protein [Actinokineospora iranica]|uniref:DUF3558 domain-containing protein n=1 Tax=Actinokineospora iranica TaxID=1271860 RepID=UPI00111450DC|nr:DUF3558 domain-containing protein [Actinokineospora iranica]
MPTPAPRLLLALPATIALAVTLAACSSDTPGTPLPEDTTTQATSSTARTSPRTTSKPAKPDSPLAHADPCTLIPDTLKTQLKLVKERNDDTSSARGCLWSHAESDYTVGITIRNTQGVSEFDTSLGAATDITIGGRPAKLQRARGDACVIAVSVTDTARVDVITVANSGHEQGCPISTQVAEVVAAQLP